MADVSGNSTIPTANTTSKTSGSKLTSGAILSASLLRENLKTVYTVISVVGIVGNLLCIVVLFGHAPLRRKQANYFLISQSIIDLIASIFLLFNMNVGVTRQGDSISAILCYLWTSRSIFLGIFLSSLFNITALTVERYFKTVHPVKHRIWMTKTRLVCIIVGVSVSGILLKMPYGLGGTARGRNETCLVQTYPSETISVVVIMYNFLVEYFLPLLIIAFCYIQMARSLRRNIRPPPVAAAAAAAPDTGMARARRNILKTLLIVVLVFVACTTFKEVLVLAKVIGRVPLDYAGLPFNVSQVMSFMVCCTNPFVYLVHYQEFKVGLRKLFTRRSNAIGPETGRSCATGTTKDEGIL